MLNFLFIDVNGPSATLKVTVIGPTLNKRHYQSINQV